MDISDISLKYVNIDVNRMKGSLDYDGHTLIINTYKAILPILTQHEMMIYFIFTVSTISDITSCTGENLNKRPRHKNMKDFITKDKSFCL